MCGRITQISPLKYYAELLDCEVDWTEDKYQQWDDTRVPHYNVAPGTHPFLIHRFGDGKDHIDKVTWGYRSEWAKEKGLPIAINATIEKARSPYWRALWKNGRAIVPADGWYEWSGVKGAKQPWYIRLKTSQPLFMAAITNFRSQADAATEGKGFAIVTSEATGGMVDVHDRRPVVLAAEDARIWLDLNFSADQAEHLARAVAIPPEDFEWYQVSKDVNKSGTNSPQFIIPVTLD
jgi:putative SOS response-associated peptidase YedK